MMFLSRVQPHQVGLPPLTPQVTVDSDRWLPAPTLFPFEPARPLRNLAASSFPLFARGCPSNARPAAPWGKRSFLADDRIHDHFMKGNAP